MRIFISYLLCSENNIWNVYSNLSEKLNSLISDHYSNKKWIVTNNNLKSWKRISVNLNALTDNSQVNKVIQSLIKKLDLAIKKSEWNVLLSENYLID